MNYTIGVVVFVVALLTSVMLHEAGHFLTARRYGMKATQFFVGFGPTIWSLRRGETEYGLKVIPAGGFVKIIGMTPQEDTAGEDPKRIFYRRPLRQRVVVLAAGSVTHFVLAAVLLLGVAFFQPIERGGSLQLQTVASCVPVDLTATSDVTATAAGSCPVGEVRAPAAGVLRAGDVVTSVDGRAVASYDAFTRIVRESPGKALTVGLSRAGKPLTVSITPAVVHRDVATGDAGSARAGALGVATSALFTSPSLSEGWSTAKVDFGTSEYGLLGGTAHAFAQLPHRFSGLFSSSAGSPDGPVSVVGAAQVSGAVLRSEGLPLSYRVWTLVGIVASVNFFVGLLNLLPLLPFDGGHIAVSVADSVRTRRRARHGLGEPGLAKTYAAWAPASYALFAVVTVGSLLILASNITHPVHF